MNYKWIYKTPEEFDDILLISDGEFLTGLYFVHSKTYYKYNEILEERKLSIFDETSKWLDIYFSGKNPDFTPQYKLIGLTTFRKEVLEIVSSISYGNVSTYSEIARIIERKRGIKRMSSQAVGGAVGWNPICLIIPCHRVIGKNGNLIGYGGGIKNKVALLTHEKKM